MISYLVFMSFSQVPDSFYTLLCKNMVTPTNAPVKPKLFQKFSE